MKVKIVWPISYIDTTVWIVYEDPTTLEPTLFRSKMEMSLIRSGPGPVENLHGFLKSKYPNEEIEFEDLGNWENIKSLDGFITHPFTKERVRV